jgi:integrase
MASIRKRGQKWQAQVRLAGHKSQSKTFDSRNLAVAWSRSVEGSPQLSTLSFELPTLAELIDRFLGRFTGKNHSMPGHLRLWKEELGNYRLNEIDPFMINRVTAVLAIKRVPKTVGHYMSSLSSLFNFFFAGKHIEANDQDELKLLVQAHQDMLMTLRKTGFSNPVIDPMTTKYTQSNKREVFLSDKEQKQLLDACKHSHWSKLYLMVLIALTTGARKGEILNMRWSDVNFTERTIHLEKTKNGKPRKLPITVAVIEELTRFREVGEGLIFPATFTKDKQGSVNRPFDPKKAWIKALERSGVGEIRFHDLRHTCASTLVRNGRTLIEVGRLLGHSSTQMTERYSHLAVRDTQLMVDSVMSGLR